MKKYIVTLSNGVQIMFLSFGFYAALNTAVSRLQGNEQIATLKRA